MWHALEVTYKHRMMLIDKKVTDNSFDDIDKAMDDWAKAGWEFVHL